MFAMIIAVCLSISGAETTCSLVGQTELYKTKDECKEAITDKVLSLLEDKSITVKQAFCVNADSIHIESH